MAEESLADNIRLQVGHNGKLQKALPKHIVDIAVMIQESDVKPDNFATVFNAIIEVAYFQRTHYAIQGSEMSKLDMQKLAEKFGL
jgi:predicted ATP-dependent Lon-type protease